MTKEEALKLALEALEAHADIGIKSDKAITAIKEALMSGTDGAQPEQEPVAWMNDMGTHIDLNVSGRGTPLYTTPPQRKWVGLTPQERDEINEQVYGAVPHHVAFHAAIEAKLKEKNT